MSTNLRAAIETLPWWNPGFLAPISSPFVGARLVTVQSVLALLDAAPAPGLDVERLAELLHEGDTAKHPVGTWTPAVCEYHREWANVISAAFTPSQPESARNRWLLAPSQPEPGP